MPLGLHQITRSLLREVTFLACALLLLAASLSRSIRWSKSRSASLRH